MLTCNFHFNPISESLRHCFHLPLVRLKSQLSFAVDRPNSVSYALVMRWSLVHFSVGCECKVFHFSASSGQPSETNCFFLWSSPLSFSIVYPEDGNSPYSQKKSLFPIRHTRSIKDWIFSFFFPFFAQNGFNAVYKRFWLVSLCLFYTYRELQGNKLTSIPENVFQGLTSLQYL